MKKVQKEQRFAGLKKKDFLVEVSKNYYSQLNEKAGKGAITVCILTTAVPLENISQTHISQNLCTMVEKGFPNVEFNYNPTAEAFIITTKGKAVCSSDDVYHKEVGENVAYAKALGKAFSVASRIVSLAQKEHEEWAEHTKNVSDFLAMASQRELEYVKGV